MIAKDQARARNDLNTAAKKLVALFIDRGDFAAAKELAAAATNALKAFDTIKHGEKDQS